MPSPLPPDRSHVRTEHRHPESMDLDAVDSRAIVELMTDDHRKMIDAVRGVARELASFIDALAVRMSKGGRLIYIGAGTSGRLGVLDASECPPTFCSDPNQVIGLIAGGDSALRKSSEGKEDDLHGADDDLRAMALSNLDTLIGIAAGGTTPYVLGALALAKSLSATTALLTCARNTGRIDACDHRLAIDTGPEILTGSTRLKAGSATKLVLNIISTAVFVKLGKTYSNLMVDVRATNAKLTDRAIRILIELCPELSRIDADALLRKANGQLKAAIVMQRLDLDLETASGLLEAKQGRLRVALGE